MMKEKKLSQMILKLHDRAEAAKYDGDSSPPYQEVKMLNFHDEESVVHGRIFKLFRSDPGNGQHLYRNDVS